MLKTWYNPEYPTSIVGVKWHPSPEQDGWELMQEVLAAVGSQQSAVDGVRGRINVALISSPDPRPELWNVTVTEEGLADLRARVTAERARGFDWTMTDAVLRAQPDVLLRVATTALEVADYWHDEHRVHARALTLDPVNGRDGVPAGYRCWKIVGDVSGWEWEEHGPMCLSFSYSSHDPPTLWLTVSTELELWSPRTFDNVDDVPGAPENRAWIVRAIERVAAATNGHVTVSQDGT